MSKDDDKPEQVDASDETKDKADDKSTASQTDSGDNNSEAEKTSQQAPADALSLTPDELKEEEAEQGGGNAADSSNEEPGDEKVSSVKRFFKRANVYFLLFILVLVIAVIVMVVSYLNSRKSPTEPDIGSQTLSQQALKQLANNDISVGDASQTLKIQGNAEISGQTLMRGNLNVAGDLQTGGSIQGPQLTISGKANLGATQAKQLQVAGDTAIKGTTTLRNLNVSGSSSFSGPMKVSQITVSHLKISGNGVLEVPNHITFTGPTPSRSINSSALGGGGSASIDGSDTSGTVNINTGNSPSAGCFVHINFKRNFSHTPRVIVTPVGSAAGELKFYVKRSASGFDICTDNAAPAHRSFAFDYFVS